MTVLSKSLFSGAKGAAAGAVTALGGVGALKAAGISAVRHYAGRFIVTQSALYVGGTLGTTGAAVAAAPLVAAGLSVAAVGLGVAGIVAASRGL